METIEKDYDLEIFSKAMSLLVDASKLQFNCYASPHFVSSQGVSGFGNISCFNTLADAMNFKGYRTKKGKPLTGSYLAVIKNRLSKRYGDEFVEDLVDWESVSTPVLIRSSKATPPKKPRLKAGSAVAFQ